MASTTVLGEKCTDTPGADHLQIFDAIPEIGDKRLWGALLGMQIVREI